MSILLQNLTAADITIDDIGISIPANSTFDLIGEPANDIAISTDLINLINTNVVIILDSADNTTALSIAQSIKIIQSFNNPTSKILRNGVINRTSGVISSVTYTGGLTKTITRDVSNRIDTVSNGISTITFNRDANGKIINWTVT